MRTAARRTRIAAMAESDNEQGTASGGEGAGTTTVNHTETADDAETPEEADKLLPWQACVPKSP
jgi:hypothetical protein